MDLVQPRIGIDARELVNLFTAMADSVDLRGRTGKKIAQILRDDALRQFQSGGSPGWAPLSPRTIARKRRLGYPRLNRRGMAPRMMLQRGNFGPENILMMTGALLTSWTREDDPHHVEEIEATSVSIGSDLEYAGTHQYGGPGQGWNGSDIPARPINVSKEAVDKIAELIEQQATEEN